MIDINSINDKDFSSIRNYYRAVMVAIDSNWLEIKNKLGNETPEIHYTRFVLYQNESEFNDYILKQRYKEPIKEFQARLVEVGVVQNQLKYASADYIFQMYKIKHQDETLVEHYYRFISFELKPEINDILNKRPGESVEDFRVRFLMFDSTKNQITLSIEDNIKSEMERVNDEESLKDWFVRAKGILDSNESFLFLNRTIPKENLREETTQEVIKRYGVFQDLLKDIETLIGKETLDDKFNDVKEREKLKHQAKREIEEETEQLLKDDNEDKKAARMDKAKIKVFFGVVFAFSVLGFIVAFQNHCLDQTIGNVSFFIIRFIFIIILLGFIGKIIEKNIILSTFNFIINVMFSSLRYLNIVLNVVGMSVTNNRKF